MKGENKMQLSEKWYLILKWLVLIAIPAIGTFIFAISQIWGWPPYAEQIVGTLSAVAVLIGSLIGISTANYNRENQPPQPPEGEESNG